MTTSPTTSLTYRSAGVDIDQGNDLVARIGPIAKRTFRPEVLTGLGGFGALFELPWERYQKPVLVSGTDGVGTKLKLAMQLNQHATIGIDLVAMCVNDIVVQGAEPLFFLDYYATGQLDAIRAAQVIEGIAQGCEQAGCALIGGETAEMPGMYTGEDYDLAGFCVGVVEKDELITPQRVQEGDILLGLASSGAHSNGYSLIRKILALSQADVTQALPGERLSLGEQLLCPTRIYVRPLLQLMQQVSLHGMAHITGGGFTENLPRILPAHLGAHIDLNAWPRSALFTWLQQSGNITQAEMLRTFNCGIGMIVCVAEQDAERALALLSEAGEQVWRLGQVIAHDGQAMRYEGTL